MPFPQPVAGRKQRHFGLLRFAFFALRSAVAALSDITPFILTYNEEPNLERCLESVAWASQILVLDSGSTDATDAIAARYPQVEMSSAASIATRPRPISVSG